MSDNGYSCAYRGISGRKCAFGHLIPDEYEVTEDWNTRSLRQLGGIGMLDPLFEACNISNDDETYQFVLELQKCHDKNIKPSYMKKALENTANRLGLIIPE